MKQFKTIDLWGQIILIPLCTVIAIVDVGYVFYSYIIVGSWQILSMLIHLMLQPHYIALKARRYYSITAVGLLLLMMLFFPTGQTGFIYYGIFMLLVSPFVAIWYLYICYEEKKRLEHKEFVHLK